MQKQTGFLAGTLIHTDQGLVPIEQLKVNDWVLSISSGGITEKNYKRIIRIFKSEQKQPIMSPVSDIYCTDDTAFWTEKHNWISAKVLDVNTHKVYAYTLGIDHTGYYDYPQYVTNGKGYWRDLYEVGGLYLLSTPVEGVAFCLDTNNRNIRSENEAYLIDFRQGQQLYICSDYGFSNLYKLSPDKYNEVAKDIYGHILSGIRAGEIEVDEPFSDYVYNIEVEDCHPYFVGKSGYRVCYWI